MCQRLTPIETITYAFVLVLVVIGVVMSFLDVEAFEDRYCVEDGPIEWMTVWGFLAGTGAVLVGLTAVGRPARLGTLGVAVVIGAALAAVVGGFVAAAAYRAASRRLR